MFSKYTIAILIALATTAMPGYADSPPAGQDAVSKAEHDCRQGYYHLAVDKLKAAHKNATTPTEKARAAAVLGNAYARINSYDKAIPYFQEALEANTDRNQQIQLAMELGNMYVATRQWAQAKAAYAQVPDDQNPSLALTKELNLLRDPEIPDRLGKLYELGTKLSASQNIRDRDRARLLLNLGFQSAELTPGDSKLSHDAFEEARQIGEKRNENALRAEAYDGLSQLYERDKRFPEAQRLVEQGLRYAGKVDVPEATIHLESRLARLFERADQNKMAIAAYRRAIRQVEAVRSDIPIIYEDGKSSFRTTFAPLYQGLTKLLFDEIDSLPDGNNARAELLREAQSASELVKQTELEDFLRDRCSVSSAGLQKSSSIPPFSAIYYPIVLDDRLELIVETNSGRFNKMVRIKTGELQAIAEEFIDATREPNPDNPEAYKSSAIKLYGFLIQPIEKILLEEKIKTIIVVPDGFLRRVAFGALHDGHQFLIQKFAVSNSPGLTSLGNSKHRNAFTPALLAGLFMPGIEAVKKIPFEIAEGILTSSTGSRGRGARSRGGGNKSDDTGLLENEQPNDRNERIQQNLILNNVDDELQKLRRILSVKERYLDSDFTQSKLKQELSGTSYRVIHLATHGFFGNSEKDTFILSHDDLLHINDLRELIGPTEKRGPIDLIVLSACKTAAGDDSAPLGFGGVMVKTGARTAIGTLWPLDDQVAVAMMPRFYENLVNSGQSKLNALRNAQLDLLTDKTLSKEFSHPYFWAPFVLVGEWQ